jgi:hypothetical protein
VLFVTAFGIEAVFEFVRAAGERCDDFSWAGERVLEFVQEALCSVGTCRTLREDNIPLAVDAWVAPT